MEKSKVILDAEKDIRRFMVTPNRKGERIATGEIVLATISDDMIAKHNLKVGIITPFSGLRLV